MTAPAERLSLHAAHHRSGHRRRRASWLLALALLTAALVAVPILSVGSNLFASSGSGTWAHLASTVLPDYIRTTLWLCAGVGVGVVLLGVGAAWLVTRHEFPGRATFEWALVLPLAMPAYVMAYTYTDLLQYVGPVQTALREAFGWQRADYWFLTCAPPVARWRCSPWCCTPMST